MRKVKVAAIQMRCSDNVKDNIEKAKLFIVEAAQNGANIVVIQELFENLYFCQQECTKFYSYATEADENPAIKELSKIAKQYNVVIPVPFYEKSGKAYYNSVAVIDADGTNLGIYRKSHIPTGNQYLEKAYFTTGDTGFKSWKTKFCSIGVGICWDQYFIEQARIMAIMGAEMLIYPTAAGNDPYVKNANKKPWQNAMRGHAASNMMPVIAANRVGVESITGDLGSSELTFMGSSFITDETGELVAEADNHSECVLYAEFDLDTLEEKRSSYGHFCDRRPELYGDIVKLNGGAM